VEQRKKQIKILTPVITQFSTARCTALLGNTVKRIIKPVKRDISYFKVVFGKCVVVPLMKSCHYCAYQAH